MRQAVTVTPKAASAASVTALVSASARSVQSSVIFEAWLWPAWNWGWGRTIQLLASGSMGVWETPGSLHPPAVCPPQAQVEGPTCSHCRPHHFYLSASNPEGCLPCFCMGVTQQCASSSYARHLVRPEDATPLSAFLPSHH